MSQNRGVVYVSSQALPMADPRTRRRNHQRYEERQIASVLAACLKGLLMGRSLRQAPLC